MKSRFSLAPVAKVGDLNLLHLTHITLYNESDKIHKEIKEFIIDIIFL